MTKWSVEIHAELSAKINQGIGRQIGIEVEGIRRDLEQFGPEAFGPSASDIEGVPSWKELGGYVSLHIPVFTGFGWPTLSFEVGPGMRIMIMDLTD